MCVFQPLRESKIIFPQPLPIAALWCFCDHPQTMQTKRQLEVVDYNPGWPEDFEREAMGLREVFAGAATKIHHVGSTAVPDLRAKPTIDILIEVPKGTNIAGFDPLMEDSGYVCRGECLDAVVPGTPGRFYYVRKEGVSHLVHVHVCAEGHFQIAEILAFRDYLRAHPKQSEQYGHHKTKLASKFRNDNVGYMQGKEAVVAALIEKSATWTQSVEAR